MVLPWLLCFFRPLRLARFICAVLASCRALFKQKVNESEEAICTQRNSFFFPFNQQTIKSQMSSETPTNQANTTTTPTSSGKEGRYWTEEEMEQAKGRVRVPSAQLRAAIEKSEKEKADKDDHPSR